MNNSQLVTVLFRARPNAPWAGYIMPALVSLLYVLGGLLEDGSFVGIWPHAVLLAICLIQVRYRTVIGWVAVLVPFIAYTVINAFIPEKVGVYADERVVFVLMGMIPSATLIAAHPFRRSTDEGSKT
jgi:hypothetical protein